MKDNIWFRGLLNAALNGAATSILAVFVLPQSIGSDPHYVGILALGGAVLGVCNYITRSPLQ